MSNPYPPQAPRKLERSRSNRLIGGVCGGLATYLNMDPTLVRILTVLISLFTGVPVILYLIALFVIPEEGAQPTYPPVAPPQHQYGPSDPVWGGEGAPWEQPSPAASPVSTSDPEPEAPRSGEPGKPQF